MLPDPLAGEVTVLGQDPAHATEDWRARTGCDLRLPK